MYAINWIIQLGDSPSDSNVQIQKHHFMMWMGLIMGMGGLFWGGLATYFGFHLAAFVPFGYSLLTVFNFLYFSRTKNFRISSFLQVFMSLALPFIFQWVLGGIVASGMVMMWSILAVIGSLAFYETRSSRVWILFFILFCLASYFIDPYLDAQHLGIQVQNSKFVSRLFFVINIGVVSSAIYFLVVYFINIRNEANVELEERNEEIQLQQELLAHQNENVMASIEYAKKIQSTIIPEAHQINEVCTDSFVIYKPRDVVSGDFYWMKRNRSKTKFFFAVADCTGHGVPGAFMSVLNSSLLERAVRSTVFEYSPEKILSYIRMKLIDTLKQKENQGKEGMDIALLCCDQQRFMLKYSGAYIPLVIVRNEGTPLQCVDGTIIEPKNTENGKSLFEIKGTKSPIGYFFGREKEYVLWEIKLLPGDRIYLTTDGYPDQLGGIDQEDKFSFRKLKSIILMNQDKSMSEQKQVLENTFAQWKKNWPQTDDVCVVGMQF